MSLTRKRAETLPAKLTLKGQGETHVFDVVYHNRKLSELQAKLESDHNPISTILYVLKEWDSEYPLTLEGVTEAEDELPGLSLAIMAGFHEARTVAKVKN